MQLAGWVREWGGVDEVTFVTASPDAQAVWVAGARHRQSMQEKTATS